MHDHIPNILLALAGLAALAGFFIAGLGGMLGLIDPVAAVLYCLVTLAGALYAGSRMD